MRPELFAAFPGSLEAWPSESSDPWIVEARQRDEKANERNWEVLGPRIGAHLDGYSRAVSELAEAHYRVADHTDLDLRADTRPAALWLLTGRCIGQAAATLQLVRVGYVLQVPPLLRSLQEALALLGSLHHDDEALGKWLRDRNLVDIQRALASIDKWQEEARLEFARQGLQVPRRTKSYFKQTYGWLSEFTHHRRRHLVGEVSMDTRIMPLGPHPDARGRAVRVWETGNVIAHLVSVGGSALATMLGRSWFVDRFQPTFRSLQELQARMPIDPETLKADAPAR